MQRCIPLSEPNIERGYRGVGGIFILSVQYCTLLDEPAKQTEPLRHMKECMNYVQKLAQMETDESNEK